MSDERKGYYFGTYRRPGHYLRHEGDDRTFGTNGRYGDEFRWRDVDDIPEAWHGLDDKLRPRRGRQGECALHHLDGWTALAFVNYTDDQRPGSNSVFLLPGTLNFDEAVAEATRRFPYITERFAFELVEARR